MSSSWLGSTALRSDRVIESMATLPLLTVSTRSIVMALLRRAALNSTADAASTSEPTEMVTISSARVTPASPAASEVTARIRVRTLM